MPPFAEATGLEETKDELASLRIDRDRPARSPWRWPLLLLLPGLLLIAGLYGLRARAAFSGLPVETVRASFLPSAEARAGAPLLTSSGYVVARRKAVVSAKIQGRLAELKVEEGSRVREGQLLARLESADYQAQVSRAAAQLERARADLAENERQLRQAEGLTRENIMARDQLEAVQSRVRIAGAGVSQARADLAYAQASLRDTRILAPFTGTVVKKMAEVGESVAPIPPGVNISTSSGAIVALADLDTLEVEADVAESNVARLGPEQPAEVAVEAFPDRRYRAVLRQVIPTADRTKATVQVKVTILDKDQNLKPEMSAKVTFLERAQAADPGAAPAAAVIVVPAEAVATREGKAVVFEVTEGKARLRPILTGPTRQGHVVVQQGLTGTETLVARPPDTLRDGDAVKVKG
jgi:RND family efflux transporter MFP subunit